MGQLNKMAEIALVCKTNYSMYVWILFTFSKWLIFEKHTSYITKLLPLKVLTSQSSYLTKFLPHKDVGKVDGRNVECSASGPAPVIILGPATFQS